MRNLEPFTSQEIDELNSVMSTLFKNGSIAKFDIDPHTGLSKANKDYDACRLLEDQIRVCLSPLRIELAHDPSFHIYFLRSDKMKGASLSADMTYTLLVLRNIYDEDMKTASLRKAKTSVKEIRIKAADMGLLTENMKKTGTIKEILRTLKRKQIITFAGTLLNLTDETPIYIQDMIVIVMSADRMARLCDEAEENAHAENIEA